MFEFPSGNPLYVFVGIVVAQLFMYGRKIKERVKITANEVIADIMQFGVMFIVSMGFLQLAKTITGWDLTDPWQLVTVVILFNMSFDSWFNRLRDTFNTKAGAAFDVFLGRKIAVEQENMEQPTMPPSHRLATPEMVYEPLKAAYPVEPVPDDIEETVHKLDDVP
jgi:hypothetical protein